METQRHIEQAKVFDIIGTPKGYHTLRGWQKHCLRHDARLTYDRGRNKGYDHKWAAYVTLEDAKASAKYYLKQNRDYELNRRCGANAKTTGQPCRMRPMPGRARCKYHGGMSTGPKSLEGKIKALSGLVQYKRRPDLLAKRIDKLKTEWI